MDPVTIFSLTKIKSVFGRMFKSPWFYAVLAFIAIGAGTYFYLDHSTKTQVTAAVKNADSNATIKSYETLDKTSQASAQIDEKFEKRRAKTQKEYTDVRTQIAGSSPAHRDAPADPLIVDTLNGLERMSREGDEG